MSTTDPDLSPGDLVLCSISSKDDSVESFYVTSDGKAIDILNRRYGVKAMVKDYLMSLSYVYISLHSQITILRVPPLPSNYIVQIGVAKQLLSSGGTALQLSQRYCEGTLKPGQV